jgi:Trk K+ transport system NAD-binding subunit
MLYRAAVHPVRMLLVALRWLRAHGLGMLVLLSVLVILAAVPAFNAEARATGRAPPSTAEAIYYALGLFAFAGNPFGFPQTTALRVMYFVAPAIAASAIFGAFARVLEERMPLLLLRFRRHTVIGGLGRLGMTVARHESRRRHAFIAIDLNEVAPQVSDARNLGVGAVVIGDMTSAAILQQARCTQARRVFFTANSDVANLDAAFAVRRLARSAGRKRPPRIYVHVFDAGLSESLAKLLESRHKDDADIVPFNGYRFAARALLALMVRDRLLPAMKIAPGLALVRTTWPEGDRSHDPPAGAAAHLAEDRRRLLAAFHLGPTNEAEEQRFCIVGLGRLGHALAANLIEHATGRPRFLVVERSEEKYKTQLETFAREERDYFVPHVGDSADHDAAARIAEFRPAAAVVCTDNDLGNLRLSLDLHLRDVRTVTRMFDLEASPELSSGLKERGIATASLSHLFHAAIPILTHERRLIACLNLDVAGGQVQEHLFYLARVTKEERRTLGDACIGLDELAKDGACPAPPDDVALVWHRAVERLNPLGA